MKLKLVKKTFSLQTWKNERDINLATCKKTISIYFCAKEKSNYISKHIRTVVKQKLLDNHTKRILKKELSSLTCIQNALLKITTESSEYVVKLTDDD